MIKIQLNQSNDSEQEFKIILKKRNPLVIGDKIYPSVTEFELSDREKEKAGLELGESDEKTRHCLQELKIMLANGNIRCQTNDAYLLRYLRFKKFDSKKAYNYLKTFYYLKENNPEFFNIPQNLKSLLDVHFYTVLPYTDEKGRPIYWMDIGKWNPEEESAENIIAATICMHDIFSMDPRCQVNGVLAIWDAEEFRAIHFSHLFRWFRLILSLVLGVYPFRIKQAFFVNVGSLSRMIYNMARPFLSRKIKDRVFFLGSDLSVLHETINPEILPKKYGGKLEGKECSVSQFVLENIQYLQHERSFV